MWIGLVMIALGTGSAIGALAHSRDGLRGKPRPYPLLYDLLGAVGFLLFGVGTLLQIPFFAGSGRMLLLLLIPIAVLKWRGVLGRRSPTRGGATPGTGEESAGERGTA